MIERFGDILACSSSIILNVSMTDRERLLARSSWEHDDACVGDHNVGRSVTRRCEQVRFAIEWRQMETNALFGSKLAASA